MPGPAALTSVLAPPALRQRVLRAGGWALAGYALAQALRLGGNLVMTRLLAPEMFGLMAIVTMVMVVLSLLSDLGMHQHIVQSRRGDDPAFLDTVWVVQIARGAVLCLAMLLAAAGLHLGAAALPAGSAYASPLLPALIAVSGVSLLIAGFRSTRMASATRRFDQKRFVQVEVASQLAGLAVMVVAGLATGSIWALVAGGLAAALAATLLSHTWMSGHANRLRVDRGALPELIGFGKWIMLSSTLGALAANGDRLLLGGLVDAQTLGLYAIAMFIVAALEGTLTHLFVTVSLPAFSEVARSDPARLREVYYKLRLPGDLVMLFTAGALAAAGEALIGLLYDARYAAAGGMLQVLSLSLFTVRFGVAQQLYLALGAPRQVAMLNVVRLASLCCMLPALWWLGGMRTALWGIALHGLATLPLVFAFNARLGINDWRRELAVLAALPAGFAAGTLLA
jgi:O-antigen/teichoic acid export membrane protein